MEKTKLKMLKNLTKEKSKYNSSVIKFVELLEKPESLKEYLDEEYRVIDRTKQNENRWQKYYIQIYEEYSDKLDLEINRMLPAIEKFNSTLPTAESFIELKNAAVDNPIYKLLNYRLGNKAVGAFISHYQKQILEENMNKKITQKIFVGAPGVGKSYTIGQITKGVPEENKTRIVFHPDYENHDFVGSILPAVNEGNVTYEFKPGPFTTCLKEAHMRPEEMHYLIIEEITRGNASAIFGEVFQLLDRNEDGESEYPITNEEMAKVIYGDEAVNENYKVVVPKNVSILATANTSDQNVFVLDTAFKRRFEFEYLDVEAEDGTDLPDINVFGAEWKDIYMIINNYIVDVLEMSEDKQIGPFFIKNQSELSKLCRYLLEDIDKASFLSEKTIFAPEYSNRFSKINKLCNKAIADDTVTAEVMLSNNFLQFIKGNNGK